MNSIQTFESYTKNLKPAGELMNKAVTAINSKIIDETHTKWCKSYPLLEFFHYESKHVNDKNETVWEYTYENKKDEFDVDITLEMRRTGSSWCVMFDFESNANGKEQSNKNISKDGLSGSKMNAEVKQILTYLNGFNKAFKAKNDFELIIKK